MKQKEILSTGAEAIILKKEGGVIKKRVKKSYRIKEIDEKIRKLRTRSEAKLIIKAFEIIKTPRIIKTDEKDKKIFLEFIKGKKLSENLSKFPLKEQKKICKKIGQNIARLHHKNVIHGDLTTSNMILKDKDIYFIDFGLGFISNKREDKSVDIHLFKQALEAKHFQNWKELFNEFRKGYEQKNPCAEKVFNQLEKVEKRGRYKEK